MNAALRSITHILIALSATIVVAQPSDAQITQSLAPSLTRVLTHPREFTVDQWTTVDGLPQNSVNAVAQTPDGYIWVGTFGGLARFDGLKFSAVERNDEAGRHVDRVLSLAVAPDSSLWIGTQNDLFQYRNGNFRKYTATDGLPAHEITALFFDHAGTLWAGTPRGGVARFDAGHFVGVPDTNGTPFVAVQSFKEDRDGVLYVNTVGHYRVVEAKSAAQIRAAATHNAEPTGIGYMLLTQPGNVRWLQVGDGIVREQRGHFEAFRWGYGPEVMLAQDTPGKYWMGTFRNGLVEFNSTGPALARPYPLPDGTTDYGTRTLLQGHDGSVWAGSVTSGLLRLKKNLFTTYGTANGLSYDIMTSVMEARDGSLWAGTNCGGVNVIDSTRQQVHTYMQAKLGRPDSDPCVFALAQDSTGVVWVGTYGGGLTRIENGAAKRVGGLGVLKDSTILALFTDRSGALWVGTNAGGLAKVVNGKVEKVYTTADGLAHNSVHTIAQTRDGSIWVGTLEGLSKLGPDNRFSKFTAANGLSSEYVRAIYEDSDSAGTMWIGTYGGGLNRLRNDKIVPINVAAGLPDNVVSSILDDGRGNLWMTGNRGIFRVTKEQLNSFANGTLRRVHSVLYGVGDGLVKAETNGGFSPAAWKDHAGRLWFPTINGLASVDPAEATDIPRPPTVNVEEVVVDGETQSASGALQIGPGRPNVEFRYSGVSLSSPDNVTFRYRLDGLDDQWIETGTRRIAYFSRLSAGTYKFFVTAANRDGVWNPVAASMQFVVLAPLYLRPWFLALMFVLLTASLLTTHRAVLRTRSLAIRDERSRLAREIHDSLLQGFGGIALQLHAVSARLSPDSAQRPALDRILATIDRTQKQAREAVWDIRPSETVLASFVLECEEACSRKLAECETEARVVVLGRTRRLSSATRTECLRIVEEALTNISKHAEATHAVVEINFAWRRLLVTITDDGKGFDLERDGRKPGHWGWLGMRERASRIGARLTLKSAPGAGTVVSIDVPYYANWLTFLTPPPSPSQKT